MFTASLYLYCAELLRQYASRLEGNQIVLSLSTLSPELPVVLSLPIVSKLQSSCEIMSKRLAFLENLNFKVKYQSKT